MIPRQPERGPGLDAWHIEPLSVCELEPPASGLKGTFLMLFGSTAVQDKLDRMVFIWENIHTLVEEREAKLLDVMELAEKFWCDHMSLVVTTKDTQDFIRDLEDPGIDPSVVKQQQEAAEVSRRYQVKKQVVLSRILDSFCKCLELLYCNL